ncbi:MAG TPA: uracil-DNA glycosylase, partial [Erysipelothrix sp.]|nr:uracil-DNA glycosylase [Erysipelothrix sp.]
MNWSELIQTEQAKEYFKKLLSFLATERNLYTIYPKNEDVFNAFKMTPFEEVRVVLIGQDPYHGPNQAMGLSFSVHKEVAVPKSLINIYKELKDDLNIENHHGDLSSWAKQGVLLLNTTLTVRAGEAFSHANQGWETFTSTMI